MQHNKSILSSSTHEEMVFDRKLIS